MKMPQSLSGSSCEELVERWGIAPELAASLIMLETMWEARFPGLGSLRIISGFRTAEEQEALLEDPGSRATAVRLSTHTSCPATGADLTIPIAVDDLAKLEFGTLVLTVPGRLRWGGGSPLDEKGIPADWNHVDLGPRGS